MRAALTFPLAVLAMLLPPRPAVAGAASAELRITLTVRPHVIVPVLTTEPQPAAGSAALRRVTAPLAPAGGGRGSVFFTDGAPPAFVLRMPQRRQHQGSPRAGRGGPRRSNPRSSPERWRGSRGTRPSGARGTASRRRGERIVSAV